MACSFAGLALRNPILVASGTYGSGLEAAPFVDLAGIGGVVTKSVTTKPRRGNPTPRIYETTAGMLNSIGLMNPGADGFAEKVLPEFTQLPCARILNIAGESVEDFAVLTQRFGAVEGVDALELNVSCPNVSGGLDFGTRPEELAALVRECRARTRKPLIIKLTPNVTDITELAKAAVAGGADALSMVNTFQGMAVDWRRKRPELGSPSGMGGLSGPAIKPLALAALWRVKCAVNVPLIGIGGIMCAEDVMDFIVCGASAVQIGTCNFTDPAAPLRIAQELATLCQRESLPPLRELVGTLQVLRR
ncbi:MAG: dihydroorotate dehydrogenase [Planctomycetes bacterium]|nr:dihydroorotate dehydrogenase [Planctomycetota bacterium]